MLPSGCQGTELDNVGKKRVLILVILDFAFWLLRVHGRWDAQIPVLILIILDVALWRKGVHRERQESSVLILLIMDVAF